MALLLFAVLASSTWSCRIAWAGEAGSDTPLQNAGLGSVWSGRGIAVLVPLLTLIRYILGSYLNVLFLSEEILQIIYTSAHTPHTHTHV